MPNNQDLFTLVEPLLKQITEINSKLSDCNSKISRDRVLLAQQLVTQVRDELIKHDKYIETPDIGSLIIACNVNLSVYKFGLESQYALTSDAELREQANILYLQAQRNAQKSLTIPELGNCIDNLTEGQKRLNDLSTLNEFDRHLEANITTLKASCEKKLVEKLESKEAALAFYFFQPALPQETSSQLTAQGQRPGK